MGALSESFKECYGPKRAVLLRLKTIFDYLRKVASPALTMAVVANEQRLTITPVIVDFFGGGGFLQSLLIHCCSVLKEVTPVPYFQSTA
jgi:hypothetical protein